MIGEECMSRLLMAPNPFLFLKSSREGLFNFIRVSAYPLSLLSPSVIHRS